MGKGWENPEIRGGAWSTALFLDRVHLIGHQSAGAGSIRFFAANFNRKFISAEKFAVFVIVKNILAQLFDAAIAGLVLEGNAIDSVVGWNQNSYGAEACIFEYPVQRHSALIGLDLEILAAFEFTFALGISRA